MVIEVMFKRGDVFGGKSYDFELAPDEKVPEVGSIIRMVDVEGRKVCNMTRVKVVDVKPTSDKTSGGLIVPIPSSMEEKSLSER